MNSRPIVSPRLRPRRHLNLPNPAIPLTLPTRRKSVRSHHGACDNVVIIGAGLSGLSAALRLRGAGKRVTVIEATSHVGGRCATETLTSAHGEFRADTGATVFTMPQLVASALAAVGRTPAELGLTFRRLQPAYRGLFPSGRHIDLYSDADVMRTEISRFAAEKFGDRATEEATRLVEGYNRHRAWVGEVFSASYDNFLAADFDGLLDMVSTPAAASDLGHLTAIGAFGNLQAVTRKHLADDELEKLFTFQALYAGTSPKQARAVYAVISHMDSTMGVYYPQDNIGEVAEAMATAARDAGVEIVLGDAATSVGTTDSHITTIRTQSGKEFRPDVVISTIDLGAAGQLFGQPLKRRRKGFKYNWSPSAVVVHGSIPSRITAQWPSSRHHTISFGMNWERTFSELIADGALMSDPSLLVTRPAVSSPSRLFGEQGQYEPVSILAPAPNVQRGSQRWQDITGPYVTELLAELESRGFHGLADSLAIARVESPRSWAADHGFAAGTPFSLAHTFSQTGPFRPRNRAAFGLNNLVLAGTGTTPGVGVPTVILSGALAARRITGGGVR
ncbi:phytoene desaturase family protein [Corynebacterium auriscanis]|uniref:phytoene desaturase family protein n=1 Tax=Corynebacterium auriscanis TaxID=99807 RepID=UPI000691D192|nr:phytoene desaturase family protein [Corynebacterium auriscanis]WJY72464.1 zeta-carotene-forming phytoene desaturase [Corynebacterium auriscanis]